MSAETHFYTGLQASPVTSNEWKFLQFKGSKAQVQASTSTGRSGTQGDGAAAGPGGVAAHPIVFGANFEGDSFLSPPAPQQK